MPNIGICINIILTYITDKHTFAKSNTLVSYMELVPAGGNKLSLRRFDAVIQIKKIVKCKEFQQNYLLHEFFLISEFYRPNIYLSCMLSHKSAQKLYKKLR